MSMNPNRAAFKIQFDTAMLAKLAGAYDYRDDTAALAAGRRIADGEFSRANLEIIFEWKTKGRGRSRLLQNPESK